MVTPIGNKITTSDIESKRILEFEVKNLQTLTVRSDIDLDLFFGGGSNGGTYLQAHEALVFSHKDFRSDQEDVQNSVIIVNGIAKNAGESGTAYVFGFMR